MAIKYNVQSISQLQGRDIFLDANILIYLFWPTGSIRWENTYATAFARLLRQQNVLHIDFLVISEVVNRAMRTEYEKHLSNHNLSKTQFSFKTYRDCQDGKDALNDIYLVVENDILNRFNFIGKAFSKSEVSSFLNVDSLDFVDKV